MVEDHDANSTAASLALRVDRSMLHRLLNRDRLRSDAADRIAVTLGRHPSELWPEWFAAEPVSDDGARGRRGGPVLTVEEAAAYLRISRGLPFAAMRNGTEWNGTGRTGRDGTGACIACGSPSEPGLVRRLGPAACAG